MKCSFMIHILLASNSTVVASIEIAVGSFRSRITKLLNLIPNGLVITAVTRLAFHETINEIIT